VRTFLVEQAGEILRVHAVGLHEIDQHPGINGAAARAHHQSIEGGKAHGGINGFSILYRAHAGAVAKMRDEEP